MKKIIYFSMILFLVACGGNTEKSRKTEKNSTVKEVKKVIKVAVEEEKEEIEIKLVAMGENMAAIAFEPKSLTVPFNSRVILTFENKSSAEGMLHNFVLVKLGSGADIAAAGMKAGPENNFVPKDDRIYANTTMTNMGETVIIEFDAPAKGSYHYICTYPGHTSMIGRFNVQ